MYSQLEPLGEECADSIIEEAVYVDSKNFFVRFGVWDDDYLSSLYGIICTYCPRI